MVKSVVKKASLIMLAAAMCLCLSACSSIGSSIGQANDDPVLSDSDVQYFLSGEYLPDLQNCINAAFNHNEGLMGDSAKKIKDAAARADAVVQQNNGNMLISAYIDQAETVAGYCEQAAGSGSGATAALAMIKPAIGVLKTSASAVAAVLTSGAVDTDFDLSVPSAF